MVDFKMLLLFLATCSVSAFAAPEPLFAAQPPPEPKPVQEASADESKAAEPETASEHALSEEDFAAAHASLVEREQAYFDAVHAKNRVLVEPFLAADALFLDDIAYRGKGQYINIMKPLFEGKNDFAFEAVPSEVHLARSGEMGWTSGTGTTSFTRPGTDEVIEFTTRYIMVWTRNGEGPWQVRAYSPLVVHATRGETSDPRSALLMSWPELNDLVETTIKIEWTPERTQRAASGEMAYSVGQFHAQFNGEEESEAGVGGYVTIWEKDDRGRWQAVGEGYSPPQIYDAK